MQHQIIPVWGLGSPAAVEMGKCSQILVDPMTWPFIPPAQKAFIIEHEKAHCHHKIESEQQADAIAFEAFVQNGGDPEDALRAITENLDMSDPAQQQRAWLISQKIENEMARIHSFGPYESNIGAAVGAAALDSSVPSQDTSGWDFEDWNNLFESALTSAPDIIRAARGQAYHNPNTPAPEPPKQSFPVGAILIGVGTLLFTALLIAIIKRK